MTDLDWQIFLLLLGSTVIVVSILILGVCRWIASAETRSIRRKRRRSLREKRKALRVLNAQFDPHMPSAAVTRAFIKIMQQRS